MAKEIAMPLSGSPSPGPALTRPRLGFSPTRPQKEAGLRIEPPPSPPCAIGTMPAAAAAAPPPVDPAVDRAGSQGLRVMPERTDLVSAASPSSDEAVRPRLIKPA